jgi:DNA-binding CsgD family transcriptional regulator
MNAQFDTPILCPVMIGRAQDRNTLRLLVNRAKSVQGQIALVSGEAGIGKSRLVAEVKAYAASHDFLLLQGKCFPTDHAIPYAPLLDLLRSFLTSRSLDKSTIEVQLVAQAFLPLLPDIGDLFADGTSLATLTPLDPEQEKRRRFETLAHFLISQTRVSPTLLLMEDLHWSDETSLEFLHYLARRCSASPILLLLTYRSDEVHSSLRHFLAQLDRERLAQEISLTRLTRDEVEAMLRAIFALQRSAHVELPDRIYAITEGNPFFVEEMLKSLITAGEIYYANGRWERKPMGELHIPRSVQDAVRQRTDQLSEPTRHVLILAAVTGRRFDFGLLQQLTHYDEQHLLMFIKELIAAQLVVEESAEQFAFRHALTRQAIYANLLVRERKALHRTIANTMEHIYVSTLDAHLADLAYHFFETGAWEQAMAYGLRAGELAQRLYAPHATIEQVTRALDAAKYGSIMPPTMLYRLRGQAYETLGEFERAHADYKITLQMAQNDRDRYAEWQALMNLGYLWTERDYLQAGTSFQQALVLARQMDDPLTLAHTLNRLGNWHMNIEQPREALLYHQEALALFQQAHDRHGLAKTYDLLGMTNFLGGDLLEGAASSQQAVTLFQELDDRQGLASSLSTLMLLGGIYETNTTVPAQTSFTEGFHFGEQALAIARESGSRSAEIYALLSLGQYLGPRGEYAIALKVSQEGMQIAEAIEHRQWKTLGNCLLGVLSLDLLDLKASQQYLGQALAQAKEIGSWNLIHNVSGILARVLLLQQDRTSAEAILTAVLEPDAPMQTLGQRLVWIARAELKLFDGDPDGALGIIDRLIASASNLSDEHVVPLLWKYRGEALFALGREAESESVLRSAQETARVQGLRPLLWRISVAQGLLYRTQGRKIEAAQAFSAAKTLIEGLAVYLPDEHVREQFLRQATAMLPHVRPLTPDRAAKQAYDGLTTREREVAVLIVQGKSNRQIADALFLSQRTVATHVSNVLMKLNVTSRSQIAAWASEKGLGKVV